MRTRAYLKTLWDDGWIVKGWRDRVSQEFWRTICRMAVLHAGVIKRRKGSRNNGGDYHDRRESTGRGALTNNNGKKEGGRERERGERGSEAALSRVCSLQDRNKRLLSISLSLVAAARRGRRARRRGEGKKRSGLETSVFVAADQTRRVIN